MKFFLLSTSKTQYTFPSLFENSGASNKFQKLKCHEVNKQLPLFHKKNIWTFPKETKRWNLHEIFSTIDNVVMITEMYDFDFKRSSRCTAGLLIEGLV